MDAVSESRSPSLAPPMPSVGAIASTAHGAPVAEVVARHAAFVRGLARRLCANDADAEDLCQDTWVEALRRPPRAWQAPTDRPEGWLARVMQRLAWRRARGERRRAEREGRVRAEGARAAREAGDASLEHALVLRDVADALVDLDEDARRLVLARHFEGLELVALAQREGVAVSTLKLRLAAVYERLRARLDERAGGDRARWTRALVAATGGGGGSAGTLSNDSPKHTPAREASPARPTRGIRPSAAGSRAAAGLVGLAGLARSYGLQPLSLLTMGFATKLSVVAALGALVASGLALRGPSRTDASLAGTVDEPHETPAPTASALEPGRGAALREAASTPEVVPPKVTAAPTPLSELARLEVLVTDLDGAPASGVEVLMGPWGAPLNRVGKTDDQGVLALNWRPGFGDPRCVVALRPKGRIIGGLRTVSVAPGAHSALRFALDASLLPQPLTSGASFLLDVSLSEVVAQVDSRRFTLNAGQGRLVARLGDEAKSEPERRRGGAYEADVERLAGGELAFVVGPGRVARAQVAGEIQVLSSRVVRLSSQIDELRWFAVDVDGSGEARGKVRGIVRDLAGLPAGGVRVQASVVQGEGGAGGSGGRPTQAVTDGAGHYELQVPVGRVRIVAGAGVNPGAEGTLSIRADDELEFDATVDRGLTLVGRIVDGAGEPRAGVHVEATAAVGDGRWYGIGVCDTEGNFALPHCPALALDVDVVDASDEGAVAAGHFEGLLPGGGEVWVGTVDAAAQGKVRITVPDDALGAVAAGELRVFDGRGERGVRRSLTSKLGSAVELSLPFGAWRVGLGATGPQFGEVVPVQVFVAEGSAAELDLGVLGVGPSGTLALPAAPQGCAWRVDRVWPGCAPQRVMVGAVAGEGGGGGDAAGEVVEVELPPGRYSATVRDAEGMVRRGVEVEVVAGRRVLVSGEVALGALGSGAVESGAVESGAVGAARRE